MKNILFLGILILTPVFSFSQNPGDATFQAAVLHDINITFTQPDYFDSLMYYKQHPDSVSGTQKMMAGITIDGTFIDSIGIEFKGNSSFGCCGTKRSIKITFNNYVSGKKYDGLTVIDLNNNALDPTMMREKLMLDFMNAEGLPAPRCAFAKVNYNGQFIGVYKMIEQVNKQFISTHYSDWGGNLFKGDPQGDLMWHGSTASAYYPYYELHSNKVANDWSDLVNLIDNINNTPAANFRDTLESVLNTAPMIGQWAARNLFVDEDSYFNAPHNYYLYHNTSTNKFEWNTWDVSVSFGFYPFHTELQNDTLSILSSNFPLTNHMLADPVYKTAYLNAICNYLDYFDTTNISPMIDSLANVIRPAVYLEPDSNKMFPNPVFEGGLNSFNVPTPMGDIPGLKKFIADRRASVISQLALMSFTCTNSVNDLSDLKPDVKVYPNPFSTSTTLRIANGTIANDELKIYDMLGREVRPAIIINSDSFVISRGDLKSGMYFYRLINKNLFISSGKLIVQ